MISHTESHLLSQVQLANESHLLQKRRGISPLGILHMSISGNDITSRRQENMYFSCFNQASEILHTKQDHSVPRTAELELFQEANSR
jgi:hypothetical protein